MKTEYMKKTTFRLSPEKMKKLKMHVLEHDTSIQKFLENAMYHCMKKNILPENKK